jgi:protein-S-isoprenylcysteine O-methyltransferase Ste14
VKAIAQLVVHVFDLLEAEGSALRTAVRAEARRAHHAATGAATGAATAIAMLVVSISLLVGGLGLLAAALLWWLETLFARPVAASLAGVVILGIGAGCLFAFRAMAEGHRRRPGVVP